MDYLFHVADAYCNAKAELVHQKKKVTRFELVRIALMEYYCDFVRLTICRMGAPILSGALTTIFSGAILILCTIQIFSKMGIIIVFNLGMAIIFALTLFLLCCY